MKNIMKNYKKIELNINDNGINNDEIVKLSNEIKRLNIFIVLFISIVLFYY